MGTDLRLLPVEHLHETAGGALWGYSHVVLELPRRSAAWDRILKMPSERIPESADVSSFVGARVPNGDAQGETMYGRMRANDAYGDPYTWVRAGDLRPLLAEFFHGEPATAYVNALKDDVRVILDWH